MFLKEVGFLRSRSYIHGIIKVMRYIVKVVKNGEIEDIYFTNDHSSAMAIKNTAKQIYDQVWICDCLIEIMVG